MVISYFHRKQESGNWLKSFGNDKIYLWNFENFKNQMIKKSSYNSTNNQIQTSTKGVIEEMRGEGTI